MATRMMLLACQERASPSIMRMATRQLSSKSRRGAPRKPIRSKSTKAKPKPKPKPIQRGPVEVAPPKVVPKVAPKVMPPVKASVPVKAESATTKNKITSNLDSVSHEASVAAPKAKPTTAAAPAKEGTAAAAKSTGPPPPAARKKVTPEERVVLRAARKERVARAMRGSGSGGAGASASSTNDAPKQVVQAVGMNASRIMWPLAIGVPTLFLAWGYNDENSPPAKLSNAIGLTDLIGSVTDVYARPSHEKLLPDWNDMPNVPHDIPVPHTLVLDLEETLVSSSWDRKHGWRYAKRPGVDKFLHDMAQYYEIVLYSPSLEGVADPVVNTLDKSGAIMHRLFREKTHFVNGTHVKDLGRLNRNLNRIVVLDDDPAAVQLNPGNLIRVKPYLDATDREDQTLARITPLLIEIAREGYNDVPAVLSQFEGMDADQMADEHQRRIDQLRMDRQARARGGLGRFAGTRDLPPPELSPADEFGIDAPKQLTAKDLVGAAPPSPETEEGVMGWLNRRNREKAEEQTRKMEYWNEVMLRKQAAQKKEKDIGA